VTTVVDASFLVAVLVDAGAEGRWARATLAEGAPVAPELVLVETTNVLRRLERTSDISEFQAAIAQRDLLRLRIETFPFEPLAARVWALRKNLTAYDAWYVALAEALGAPLATLDRRLARAAEGACETMTPGPGGS
jgi:predicted nucleic acid-binding protein